MNEKEFPEKYPTYISDFFASGDSRISNLILPEGVEEIGMGAFSFASCLQSVRLPNSLRIIGVGAFHGCQNLKELFISGNVTELRGAFAAVPNLTKVTVDESSGLHLDGALLIRGDTLIRVFPSLLKDKVLCVPQGIQKISGGAFAQCEMLEKIHLPDSLKIIESGAFSRCKKMSRITIPDEVVEIGGGAFAGNSLLHELLLPDSLTKIGEWCCEGCDLLRHVILPSQLCYPANAFPPSCRKQLRGVAKLVPLEVLTTGLREIAPYAFAGRPELEEITIPESVVSIGEGAFQEAQNLKAIRLPKRLKNIERNAFASLPKLERIDLPDSITEIPQGCFWNCTSLRHITLPGSLRSINRYAFRDCTALEELRIPEGVISLVSGAFQGCTALREVFFPESLRVIGSGDFLNPQMEFPGTFERCVSLREIQLPPKLDLLNDFTFRGCTRLKQVRMPSNIGHSGKDIFASCPTVQIMEYPFSVPNMQPEWVRKLQTFRSLKIGFLFALTEEATAFARCLGYEGTLPLRQPIVQDGYHLIVCGTGRANASSGTIQLFRAGCQVVVNIGTAGAYKINATNRIYVPEVSFDGDAFLGNPKENLLDPARLNTSDAKEDVPPIITISSFGADLQLPFATLIDNEAYAVAVVARALGIKRMFLKIVSDHADVDAPMEFKNTLSRFSDFVNDVGNLLIAQLEKLANKGITNE